MSSSDSEKAPAAVVEAQPYQLAELEPGRPVREQAEQGEKDGFRLLIVDGRAQDPRERAEREAGALMSQAREAVDQARAQAEEIKKQAYEEAYQEGKQEGREAERSRMEAAAGDMARALAALESARSEILAGMEGEILAMVQAICDHILLTPDSLNPRILKNLISQSIAALGRAERVSVRLSGADWETAAGFLPELEDKFSDLEGLELTIDQGLSPGDCLAVSETTQVEAALASRRERIYAALEEAFRQGPPLDLAALLDEKSPAGPRRDQTESEAESDVEGW